MKKVRQRAKKKQHFGVNRLKNKRVQEGNLKKVSGGASEKIEVSYDYGKK